MLSRIAADLFVLTGLLCFLAGIYLLAGLPWALVAAGPCLAATGVLLAAAEREDVPDTEPGTIEGATNEPD